MEDSVRDWGQEEKEKGTEWRKRWVVPVEGCVGGKKVTETVKTALLRRWYRKIWRQATEDADKWSKIYLNQTRKVIFLQCYFSSWCAFGQSCLFNLSDVTQVFPILCFHPLCCVFSKAGGGEGVTRGKLVRWNKATVMLRPQAPPSWAKLSTVEFFSRIVDLEAIWPELKIRS